ncbi:PTS system mannose/fructose/sorbose family transporter subunit IID [Paucilactobacillus suebicus]|uniref:PTS system mannose fructose sorbose family transporter subunit IID n=1 Tax=Paucilactobacillus suebicus DSM 5007 = KCTC 3549 TaxID=1423807 RepID=A0A0R1W427_9LACO|nr:PTS system mannose/fructose/sorbose family transporter subunit IID [Paucilactobacillus suebicus]KRM10875.1 PTS system mannose fructose sorbose family transporter subunit IID [Paucilactobacillus suebicus DSM 5007 = KCTC 3549]
MSETADIQATNDEAVQEDTPKRIPQPDKITNKDLMKSWFGWWWANEVPHTFDRMLAPSFCFGLIPSLKKLYKDHDELAKAFQRHLLFFNTQATWGGGTLTGVTISLEEARAKAMANGEEAISEDMINNTKVGLMGPLAGIGDSIDSGTVQYIFIAIFLPFAQKGNFLGALLPFLCFSIATFIYGYYLTKMGYTLGRNAAKEIMTGGRMAGIIDGLGVMGLYMMGILAGQYITVKSYLKFDINQKTFDVQKILDTIMPGMLPLLTVVLLYLYFQKQGLKITRGLLYLTGALIVLSIFYII